MESIFAKNTPRWIIFTFDVTVALFAFVLAYLLRFNFNIPVSEYKFIPLALVSILVVRILFYYLFKTYSGIIRYTSTQDAARIAQSTVLGSVILAVLNLVRFYFIDDSFLLPFSVLVIEFLATTFFLIAFRIGIKVLYFELKNPSKEKSTVVIYGAGEAGVIAKRSIDRDAGSKLKVVAFLDDDKRKFNNKVEGVKIFDGKKLESIIETQKPTHLIISSRFVSPDKKHEIIELCLKLNVNVLNVPPISKWINGELSFNQIKRIDVEDLLERPQIQLNDTDITKFVKGKVVLITGAAGSIGSEIARQLAKYSPKELILVDSAESALYELDFELKNSLQKVNYSIVIGDVRNEIRMANVFNTFKPRVVFHAAAYKHVPLMEDNPTESVNTNVLGTKIIADLASENKVEKMVFISTDKAVNPTNVMGACKRVAEMYVQSLNVVSETQFITTRFGNVLGSNGSVIPLFKKQIAKGGPVYVTHPEITRYFMTIPEACQLVLQAGTIGSGGEVFVFDMGQSVKIADLAKKMIKMSGLKLGRDIQIVYSGLRPGEKLYEELLTDNETTIKTPHKKIHIAKVEEVRYDMINAQVHDLIKNYGKQNNSEIVAKIKGIVREYKSENSKYESLD
ncbi:MAG: polysaccharide biosynthesis protein [Flavobacteriales bacterium]|nr:polysaccharide biosynthesis protein [Flavobacteriales bacterium]